MWKRPRQREREGVRTKERDRDGGEVGGGGEDDTQERREDGEQCMGWVLKRLLLYLAPCIARQTAPEYRRQECRAHLGREVL